MNIPHPPTSGCRALRSLLLVVAALPAFALAQPVTPSPSDVQEGSSSDSGTGDKVVALNPFEVNAANDRNYNSLNSNSITNFNTELNKLPISADIIDQAFMNDIAADNVEAMVTGYSAGVGLSDSSGGGPSTASNQPGDRVSSGSNLVLNGLPTAIRRDGFMALASGGTGYTSSFDIERVETINGPQSILYGGSGNGGIINTVSKQARLGQPAFGSLEFRLDQYGGKQGQLDYGMGNDKVAVRATIINNDVSGRRTDIGGPFDGVYVQVAVRPFRNTVIRIEAEDTFWNRITSPNNGTFAPLSAASTSNDARNGDALRYLMATNQINSAANGAPSGAGVIDNGFVNWGNIDSFGGQWLQELTVNRFETMDVATTWNDWLSTRVQVGYNNTYDDLQDPNLAFYAPNNSTNILGVWAARYSTPDDGLQDTRGWEARTSILATNDLFGGQAHSQTSIGADMSHTNKNVAEYMYFQADSNFNVIISPSGTDEGRTPLTSVFWPVDHGPVKYNLFTPRATRLTWNGVNYVRQLVNQVNPAYISAINPLGLAQGGGSTQKYAQTNNNTRGIFGVNYTEWLKGKLTTIIGFRVSEFDTFGIAAPPNAEGTAAAPYGSEGDTFSSLKANPTLGINFGADYAIRNWLRAYISGGIDHDIPSTSTDPYGVALGVTKARNAEVGLKLQNESGTISGSLSAYRVDASNSKQSIGSSIEDYINPVGLNGQYRGASGLGAGSSVGLDNISEGVHAVITAAPLPNWRLRVSAAATNGTLGTGASFAQFYNDQFHANAAGQVTYADGTVVYVPAAFNGTAKTVAFTQADAPAGAIPLTVAAMSTPSNAYYASPQPINGQILATSAAAVVLTSTPQNNPDQVAHGSILTGVTGLPISSYQLNPALSGVSPGGVVQAVRAGDVTTGYPEYTLNLTSVYTFPAGWIKGFRVGGSALMGWQYRRYYYYDNATLASTPNAPHNMYYFPTLDQFNAILGYSHKFKRITWDSQLNITNIFNTYQVVILPDSSNGYTKASALNATFTQQPRDYTWTNTLRF